MCNKPPLFKFNLQISEIPRFIDSVTINSIWCCIANEKYGCNNQHLAPSRKAGLSHLVQLSPLAK